jgi:hypothetical protein
LEWKNFRRRPVTAAVRQQEAFNMTLDEFWELNANLPPEDAESVLRDRLERLQSAEVASYQEHFDRAVADAYRWDLWAAAYTVGGGCGDDGFTDFRYGLISRGRLVYENALEDPETLVNVADDDTDEGFIPNESFGYVARTVYETLTGSPMPDNDVQMPLEPVGTDWDFDDRDLRRAKLPRLTVKFDW